LLEGGAPAKPPVPQQATPATPATVTPATTTAGETPPATTGKGSNFLTELEAALTGESPPAAGSEGTAGGGSEVPLGLTKVAEAMGVSESDLFGMQISMPDGAETRSLGQLKDAQTELNRTRAEVETFYQERETQRTEFATARGELETLFGMIPAEMRTPAMLQQARERIAVATQDQARKLVERVPEWANAETRAADMGVMNDHIGRWGFNSQELASLLDHRMMAYVRHNALQEQRLNVLLGKSKAKPAGSGKPQRGRGSSDDARSVTARAANAMQSGNRTQQATALGELLRSKGVTL
jgi:hypothetical protein